MELAPNLEIVDLSLWLKVEKILVVGDFHLGYEEYLQNKGILLPKQQLNQIIKRLKLILTQTKPQIIIINGDLKHDFGRNSRQEWKDVLKLIDFLKENCQELIFIKGNHDNFLQTIAEQRQIGVVEEYNIKNILITHGDKISKTKAKLIIIGHEHPAITLRDKSKVEKYKCFLKGKYKSAELIVMPSFNLLLEGTDILKDKSLSPYLTNIKNFQVFIVSKGEAFDFGKVKDYC